jgi:hypothetical protein
MTSPSNVEDIDKFTDVQQIRWIAEKHAYRAWVKDEITQRELDFLIQEAHEELG